VIVTPVPAPVCSFLFINGSAWDVSHKELKLYVKRKTARAPQFCLLRTTSSGRVVGVSDVGVHTCFNLLAPDLFF